MLGVSPPTIYQELKRNKGQKGYRSKQAQNKADKVKKLAVKAQKMTPALIVLIEDRIIIGMEP